MKIKRFYSRTFWLGWELTFEMHMLRADGIIQSFLLINIFISLSTICQDGSRDFIGFGKSTKSTTCGQALSRGADGSPTRTARESLPTGCSQATKSKTSCDFYSLEMWEDVMQVKKKSDSSIYQTYSATDRTRVLRIHFAHRIAGMDPGNEFG